MSTAPFVPGSATSIAAALSIAPHLPPMRAKVLNAIVRAHPHGATCDDVEAATGMPHQSASPRFRELEELGVIFESKLTRRTRSGEQAAIWHLTGNAPTVASLKAAPRKSPTKVQLRAAASVLRAHAPAMTEVIAWLEKRSA